MLESFVLQSKIIQCRVYTDGKKRILNNLPYVLGSLLRILHTPSAVIIKYYRSSPVHPTDNTFHMEKLFLLQFAIYYVSRVPECPASYTTSGYGITP